MSRLQRFFPKSGPARLALVCVGVTALHLGLRLNAGGATTGGILVSGLSAGAPVALDALAGSEVPASTACRMVVSFSPDCPFCKRAAERERDNERSGAYGSPMWVTDKDAPNLSWFVGQLSASSEASVNLDLFKALRVQGVPGLYLFDAQDRLRWVGPYHGDESESELSDRCSEPLPKTEVSSAN
jgi:hypothetical protein